MEISNIYVIYFLMSTDTKYKALFNDSSLSSDSSVFNDLTVINSLTITGAQIDTLPVDNSTIEYSTYQLKIKDLGISTGKLADLAVSTGKIADLAVSTGKLADLAVTDAKINDVAFSKITGTSALLTETSINNVSNKSFEDSTTSFYDNADSTKKLQFQLSGITTGATRVLTPPNYNGTISTLAGTETLTNKTLDTPTIATIKSGLTYTHSVPNTSNDAIMTTDEYQEIKNKLLEDTSNYFYNSNDGSAKLKFSLTSLSPNTTRTIALPDSSGTLALTSDLTNYITTISTNNLTNKSLVDSSTYLIDDADNTKKAQFQLSGITTGTTRTLTLPDSSGTVALTSDLQNYITTSSTNTLTNKSLTDASTYFVNSTFSTKKMQFLLSSISPLATRTLTIQDADGTVALGNQVLNTTSNPTFNNLTVATLNTGQGANELYGMDQDVKTTSTPTFSTTTISKVVSPWLYYGSGDILLSTTAGNISISPSSYALFDTAKLRIMNGITYGINLAAASLGANYTATFPAATGTILYNDNTATITSKTIETANNTLKPLIGQMNKTTAQSIATSAFTQATGWSSVIDTSGSSIVDTANSRFKLYKAGYWKITFHVSFASNGTGYRALDLKVAASSGAYASAATINSGRYRTGNSSAAISIVGAHVYNAALNDYLYFDVWQNSGGALNFSSTSNESYSMITVEFLGT